MARRRRDRSGKGIEAILTLAVFLPVLLALATGSITTFVPRLMIFLGLEVALVIIGVVAYFLIQRRRRCLAPAPEPSSAAQPAAFGWQDLARKPLAPEQRNSPMPPAPSNQFSAWSATSILEALGSIDWYQFEKFCAALLEADGFKVTRKGGAQPDGGVDLIVEQSGTSALIQCKHWRTWEIKEKTVREMLGSMTHFGVKQGAVYTLKGWTQPAAQLAGAHAITLANGHELADWALKKLTAAQLDALLRSDVHHCPKCEAPMVWRTGDFDPFWGCSRYPACGGKLNRSGAR